MEDAPHGFLSDTILFVNTFCGLITPFVVIFPLVKEQASKLFCDLCIYADEIWKLRKLALAT